MADTPKIEESIIKFFEAFNKLSPDEKLYFLAQVDKTMADKSDKEKQLFLALIKAAKDGKTMEETLSELKKV